MSEKFLEQMESPIKIEIGGVKIFGGKFSDGKIYYDFESMMWAIGRFFSVERLSRQVRMYEHERTGNFYVDTDDVKILLDYVNSEWLKKKFNLSVEEFQTQLLKEMKLAEENLKGKVEEKIMYSYKVLEKKMELPTGEVTVIVDGKNYPYFKLADVGYCMGRSSSFFASGKKSFEKIFSVVIKISLGMRGVYYIPLDKLPETLEYPSKTFLKLQKKTLEQFIDSTMATVWKFCAENNLATERTAEVEEQNLFSVQEEVSAGIKVNRSTI